MNYTEGRRGCIHMQLTGELGDPGFSLDIPAQKSRPSPKTKLAFFEANMRFEGDGYEEPGEVDSREPHQHQGEQRRALLQEGSHK